MIGVLIRGIIRLVTKPQADKLVAMGRAQRIPTRGQAAAQDAGKKVTTKEYNKLAKIRPKVVKPKPKTPEYTTSAKNIKTTGGGAKAPAGNVKVTTGGAKSKLPVVAGSRAVTTTGGKAVSKTGTGKPLPLSLKGKPKGKLKKLLGSRAIVPLAAVGLGLSTLGKKPKSDQTAQATTNGKKPPKPNGKKPPKPNGKKPPKLDSAGAGFTDTEESTIGENVVSKPSRDVAADMRHFAISRGGTEKDPNRGFRRRLFGENVTEAEAAKDMKKSYKAEQADRKKISQQDFYQYGEGRRSQLKGKQGKKKGGSVIKRNKGGPVRGVGKALRGYGNNSIYSNKMY